jgi:D-tyrosyl-tRNA(Tyr) deacylase
MRAVIQRVSEASVSVEGKKIAAIEKGLLVLLGIEEQDTDEDIRWLSNKILLMRIFDDAEGKMNLSVGDIKGKIILVSQFTLHASTKKGNRPSFIKAAKPDYAEKLYEQTIETFRAANPTGIQSGKFGAMMDVALINDGPLTIFIDTKNKD